MPPRSSEASGAAPLSLAADGVRVVVRLTPRARQNRLDGIARLADGTQVLQASVSAPPEEGRANEALLQLLAREWHVPRRDLVLVGGLKSRRKLVRVAGDARTLMARLEGLLAALARA